ncbi:hypothetical protein [Lysobacter gummosus]|uniref:hypothetical protein n=1 Tax=Lysobacter gummosus TaxID=262324 RepID=UPI00362B75B5
MRRRDAKSDAGCCETSTAAAWRQASRAIPFTLPGKAGALAPAAGASVMHIQ